MSHIPQKHNLKNGDFEYLNNQFYEINVRMNKMLVLISDITKENQNIKDEQKNTKRKIRQLTKTMNTMRDESDKSSTDCESSS